MPPTESTVPDLPMCPTCPGKRLNTLHLMDEARTLVGYFCQNCYQAYRLEDLQPWCTQPIPDV
jgi:hypothetical protein